MLPPSPSKQFDNSDKLSVQYSLKWIKEWKKMEDIEKCLKKENGRHWKMFEKNLRMLCEKWICFLVVKNELNCSVTLKRLLKLKSYRMCL